MGAHPPPRRGTDVVHRVAVDYAPFKMFHLSVLFRAGVSTLPHYAQVSLGSHEATLRARCGANAIPADDSNTRSAAWVLFPGLARWHPAVPGRTDPCTDRPGRWRTAGPDPTPPIGSDEVIVARIIAHRLLLCSRPMAHDTTSRNRQYWFALYSVLRQAGGVV